jgi:peptide methionine sulfoxide reductase MsrA
MKELETFRERQGVAVDTSTGYAAGYLEQSKYMRPLAEW